jgi:hypothetical protein
MVIQFIGVKFSAMIAYFSSFLYPTKVDFPESKNYSKMDDSVIARCGKAG